MKKVLFITLRADFGGGPEHLYKLLINLSSNIEFYIAAPNDYPYFGKYSSIVGKNNVIEIPHRQFKLSSLLKLVGFIRNRGIEIIHSHGKGAGVYSRVLILLTGKKCIHTFHGFHIGSYNKLQQGLYIQLEKLFSVFTKRIIAVSKGEMNELLKYKIAPKHKITLITNGVVISKKQVDNSNFENEIKKIISFTRYDYQKNTELILDIINKLNQINPGHRFEIHLYGEGEGINLFKQKVNMSNLGQNIFIHGAVENVVDKLVEGFCYISTSRWEGLPLSLLEAMSVGLPVVASDVIGNNDIIEHGGDGFLFNIDEPGAAAKYLDELSRNKDLWLKMSSVARKKIEEKYNIKRIALQTEELYLT